MENGAWCTGIVFVVLLVCIPPVNAVTPLVTEPSGKADVVLFSDPKDRTATALDKLAAAYDYYAPASFPTMALGPYRLVVFSEESLGSTCDRGPINQHAAKMREFVETGGTVLCLRVDTSREEWLPQELAIEKATGYFRQPVVLEPRHPLLLTPNDLIAPRFPFYDPPMAPEQRILDMLPWGGGIYYPYCNPSNAWRPVIAGGEEYADYPSDHGGPHYGLLVGSYGEGKVVLCQMIPVLSFVDKRAPSAGRRFLQNLLEYCGAETTWSE